jgi:phospholipase/carboxylesterase
MYDITWCPTPHPTSDAVIFLHGRGQSRPATMQIARALSAESTLLVLPCAPNLSWYPMGFLADLSANEPALGASLAFLDEVIGRVVETGASRNRVVLAGFSQGAALATEYVGRKGGVRGLIALSGGRMGPAAWCETTSLSGVAVLLSVAERDPFVPLARVSDTATHFLQRDAVTRLEIFDGDEHCVREAEIAAARMMLAGIFSNRAETGTTT